MIDWIAEKCEVMQLFNKCIELLEKYGMPYNKSKKTYIRSVINSEKPSDVSKNNSLKLIDEMLVSENNYQLFIYKGILLTKINRKLEALECYKKAFEIESNYITAYYCLSSKTEKNEFFGLDKYISVLNGSDKLEHMLIIANAHSKSKRYNEANKKIYMIAYKYQNNISMDALAMIVFNIFFQDYNRYDWGKIEKVENDVVIILEDENKNIRKICIETDINMNDVTNKIYDVELYAADSSIRTRLLLKKKEDTITLDDKKYVIKNILNKYEYIYSKMRDLFFERLPNKSKYCEVIQVDLKNPLEKIIPILKKGRECTEQIIKWYRMENNGVGSTISILSKQLGCNEYDVISALLNDKSGIFYAGEVSNEPKEEYIVTLSSLIVSKILGIDEILLEIKDKTHIAESTINKINNYFYRKEKDNSAAVLGVGKDDKPYMIENSEIRVMDEIDLIREMLDLVSNFKVEKNNYQKDNLNLFSILDEEEQDAFCIARNNGYTLIADDLCLRRLYVFYSKSSNHNNSMEFLKYFTFDKKVEKLEKISGMQHIYCVNKEILLDLFVWCREDEKILNIITNLLSTNEKYNYNRRIIGEAILEFLKLDVTELKKKNFNKVLALVLDIDEKYKNEI